MRITTIEIENFRAFPRNYQINLTKTGKNLLVYGENGSGKTSLYKALELFFQSSGDGATEFKKYQNIFVPDDGYIKLCLRTDENSKEDTYEWSQTVTEETKTQVILDASKANGFLDYKALLHTHYLHYKDDTVDVFDLLVKSLLKNVINDLTDPPRSFAEQWEDILGFPSVEQVGTQEIDDLEGQIDIFNIGIANQLVELQTKSSEILRKFGYEDTFVALDFGFRGIEYDREDRTLNYQEIPLKVKFFDEDIASHHRFLNEAKLSAIALSIFFAGFQLQPPSGLKILAMDDALIGLDMSNRLPLLDILDEYFSDYQIFLTTYDRAWYEIAKQRTEQKDWKYVEFYFGETDKYEIPIYVEDKAYLKKATKYLNANDYKACAIYVRTAFEAIIEKYCANKRLPIRHRRDPKRLNSQDFWGPIKDEKKKDSTFNQALISEIELYRSIILNPLSHVTFANIYRKELEDAIDAVKELKDALT